jgi:hypothetical protein
MSNGTTSHYSEYGIIYNPNLLMSFNTSISGGSLYLNAVPETGISGITTYRFTRKTMN